MIVVGGWPGRHVVGLNGHFGVLPAALAADGDFDSPLLDDVDPGDEATEFAWVITDLPASGTVVALDDGGFSHTGAAPGAYSTRYQLYTWPAGGPLTSEGEGEVITLFGGAVSATAAGSVLPATVALIAGAATGAVGATAPGATISVGASLLPGAASGQVAATAAGATLSVGASLVAGAAAGSNGAAAAGRLLVVGASLLPGAAAGQAGATATGGLLSVAASLVPGLASNGIEVEEPWQVIQVKPRRTLIQAHSAGVRRMDIVPKRAFDNRLYTINCSPLLADGELIANVTEIVTDRVTDPPLVLSGAAVAPGGTHIEFRISGGRQEFGPQVVWTDYICRARFTTNRSPTQAEATFLVRLGD